MREQQRGEPEAPPSERGYEEFVAARSTSLLRLAYLLTGDAHDAQDLLQATLLTTFVKWRRAAGADSPEAYTRKIMLNTFLKGRRRAHHRHEHLVTVPPDLVAESAALADRFTLWPLVQDLPPRQRAVIVLRYLVDLSEAEIADTLGCARGTVKSTASAALKNLRARLDDGDAPSSTGGLA